MRVPRFDANPSSRILALLCKGPMKADDLYRELNKDIHIEQDGWVTLQGVYRTLGRLMSEGFVTKRETDIPFRPSDGRMLEFVATRLAVSLMDALNDKAEEVV